MLITGGRGRVRGTFLVEGVRIAERITKLKRMN